MKVEDFAYRVAMQTIALMEELQHYKVSEEVRRDIGKRIAKEVPQLLKDAS
jgi:hypothetical protein